MSGALNKGWCLAAAALAWLAGLGLQLQQPALLSAGMAQALWAGAGLCALAAVGLARWRAPLMAPHIGRSLGSAWVSRWAPRLALCTALAALALLAFLSTDLRAKWRLQTALAPSMEGKDLLVTGVISDLPRISAQGTRFSLDVEAVQALPTAVPERALAPGLLESRPQHQARDTLQPLTLPPRLSLGWYPGWDQDALLSGPAEPLRAGDRWQFPLRLKRPVGLMNPHGFDLELWLFERGLGATGTVRPGARRLPDGPTRMGMAAQPVDRLRQSIRDDILLRVANPAAAGVLAALVVGDQAAIEREDWEIFRITGVAHLMSISGLHVTMFAWLAGYVIAWAWRRSRRLMLWLPAPTAAVWGGLAAATAYALLAGWGVPAQRTLGMIAVVVLLRSFGVRWPQALVLLVAAVMVTLGDPWALLQPGFWLSFMAVALLMASGPVAGTRPEAPKPHTAEARATGSAWHGPVQAALRTQLVATIGLAPLSLVFFQQLSLVGFVANLVAIPLVSLLITPLALAGVLWPPLWGLAAALVQGLGNALAFAAGLPWAVWTAAAAPLWAMASGLLGAALLVMPLPRSMRLLGLPLLLPLLAPPIERPPMGHFEAVVADVGQGTAVLLRTRSHLLLYDTGPQYAPESDAGGRVLLPLLRARGETAIDEMLLSHRDSDHIGGAASLLIGITVRRTRSSLEDSHPLLAQLPAHQRCAAGQAWVWDGVEFEVLHPQPGDFVRGFKSNALSCVVRVKAANGRSLLLTGDAEAAQEAALAERNGAGLRSEVLLVPHHGSKTSSSAAFLDAVAPQQALVQAAYRSRYGHPAPSVLARYAERGIQVQRSDACGAWTWQTADGAVAASADRSLAAPLSGSCHRAVARRYWHTRPLTLEPAG